MFLFKTNIKHTIIWHIILPSLLEVNWHFRGTRCFHLQGWSISKAKNQPVSHWFLACPILQCWRWRQCVPLKHLLISTGLHGVITQETKLFTFTTMGTSNPTLFCDYMLCLPIANRPSFYVVLRIAHGYESKNLDSEIIYPKPKHQYTTIKLDNYLKI